MQDIVAIPEPVTDEGAIVPQVKPLGTVSVRLMSPLNPLTAVTLMVEVAEAPMMTGEGEEADMVKSLKLKVAFAERVRPPLVPLTVKT